MIQPCKFEKVGGKWKCKSCNYTSPLPHRRPPVRTCSTAYITPPRKPTPRKPTPKPPPKRKAPPKRKPTPPPSKRELDSDIKKALEMVGVEKSLVEKYLGLPCGCRSRRKKKARLNTYVGRILNGEPDMRQHLLDLLTD